MGDVVKLPVRKRAEAPRQPAPRSLLIDMKVMMRDCAEAERAMAAAARSPLLHEAFRSVRDSALQIQQLQRDLTCARMLAEFKRWEAEAAVAFNGRCRRSIRERTSRRRLSASSRPSAPSVYARRPWRTCAR